MTCTYWTRISQIPTGKSMGLYAEKFMTHQYAQLHFCNKEAIDGMIELLQRMKELWEREEDT